MGKISVKPSKFCVDEDEKSDEAPENPSDFGICAADPSFTVGMSSNGEPSDPHPPGMRVKCSSEEEEFEGGLKGGIAVKREGFEHQTWGFSMIYHLVMTNIAMENPL
jgi:hypothetical protein